MVLHYYIIILNSAIKKLEYAAMLRVNANTCTLIISLETAEMIAGILFAELVSHKFLQEELILRLTVLFSN